MEVEVKIRLPSAEAYEQVRSALGGVPEKTEEQRNMFFDGIHSPLGAKKQVLRLRHDARANRYTLTWKGNAQLVDGISRIQEKEAEIPIQDAQEMLRDCTLFLKRIQSENASGSSSASQPYVPLLLDVLRQLATAESEQEWKSIGSFSNLREKYRFEQEFLLELDRTEYPFGTLFEIEIESRDNVLRAKELIELLLQQHQIPYQYSKFNKFVRMKRGTIQD